MILNIDFYHTAKVRRRRRRDDEVLSFPATESVEIREVTSAEAPLAATFSDKHQGSRRSEVRFFDGGFYAFVHDASLDQMVKSASDRTLKRRMFDAPNMEDAHYCPRMESPLEGDNDVKVVSLTDLPRIVVHLREWANKVLLVDGVLFQSAPEPVLLHYHGGNIHVGSVSGKEFPWVAFRLDQVDFAREWIRSALGYEVDSIPVVEVSMPDALTYDQENRLLLDRAKDLTSRLRKAIPNRRSDYYDPNPASGTVLSAFQTMIDLDEEVDALASGAADANVDATQLSHRIEALLESHEGYLHGGDTVVEALRQCRFALDCWKKGSADEADAILAAGF